MPICEANTGMSTIDPSVGASAEHSAFRTPFARLKRNVPVSGPVAVEGIWIRNRHTAGDVRVVCVTDQIDSAFYFWRSRPEQLRIRGCRAGRGSRGERRVAVFSGGADNRKVRSRHVRSRRDLLRNRNRALTLTRPAPQRQCGHGRGGAARVDAVIVPSVERPCAYDVLTACVRRTPWTTRNCERYSTPG